MANDHDLPTALISVSSRNYLSGTQVMLHSFLRTNPWFSGDLVVLEDDLTPEDKAALSVQFQQISFPGISPDLMDSVQALARAQPHLETRARRFYSLDAFAEPYRGRVLFCDSDLLFTADISAMLDLSATIVACGDRAQIVGTGRDPETLSENTANSARQGFNSFNAGLMVLAPEARAPDMRARLLDQLSPQAWDGIQSDHTDQAVLNRLFGGTVAIAEPQFNFLIGHAAALRESVGAKASSAKVLHFNGPAKPWEFRSHPAAARQDASFVWAAGKWFDCYTDYLTAYHLATRDA